MRMGYAEFYSHSHDAVQHCSHDPVQQGFWFAREIADVIASAYLSAAFGANEATIFSKRGSPRSGFQRGCSFKAP